MKEDNKYLTLLEDTQKLIFKILNALLHHPIHEEVIRDHTLFMPYEDCGADELNLYNRIKAQYEYANKYGFPIARFGPQENPIISVESVFKWCVAIARQNGTVSLAGERREDFWDWYTLLLRGKRNVKPPEGMDFLRFGSSQNPREIFLFIGIREVNPIETHIRGELYQQLEEVKVKMNEREDPGSGHTLYTYDWKYDKEKSEVKCNGKGPVRLEPRLSEVFDYLNEKKPNKEVTIKTLAGNLKVKDNVALE
jgi:hypothetical protein